MKSGIQQIRMAVRRAINESLGTAGPLDSDEMVTFQGNQVAIATTLQRPMSGFHSLKHSAKSIMMDLHKQSSYDDVIARMYELGDWCNEIAGMNDGNTGEKVQLIYVNARGPRGGRAEGNMQGFTMSADVEEEVFFNPEPEEMAAEFYRAAEWLEQHDDGPVTIATF